MSTNISPVTVELVVDCIPNNRVLRRFDSDLRRIVVFFCFSKSGFINETMNN